jgi:hypothetical protein
LADLAGLDVDKRSRVAIDPLGRLVEFESRVRLADVVDAIKVHGQVEGSTLLLTVTADQISTPISRTLSANSLLGDELSPHTRMPGLRVGQSWTVPLYSPFRAPNSPLEILQAIVEREDPFQWEGQRVNTRVIVYRGDSGSGLTGGETRGRTWVRDDGLVLRQEVSVFRTPVQFERLSDARGEPIWQALEDNWTRAISSDLGQRLLEQLQATEGDRPAADGEGKEAPAEESAGEPARSAGS